MLKLKLLTLFFAFRNLIAPCYVEKKETGFHAARNGYSIKKVGRLPGSIKESSGLELASGMHSFYTHSDGGGKNSLYEINAHGEVLNEISLPATSNKDWEDLTRDEDGNIYIGDFGNNSNRRKDLVIYKISLSDTRKVDTISFTYPDQSDYPPTAEGKNFDCEAMFWHDHHLFLISKNRGKKKVNFYRIPDCKGEYVAEIFIKGMYLNSMVTSADISPDHKTVALLSYGKMYFFKVIGEGFELRPHFVKTFNRSAQSEAMVFISDTDLLISNEQGQLFVAKKKK